jgi:hypothetical protein
MPRFFFHIHDGQFLPDREGTELLNLREAKVQAVRLAGELLRDGNEAFWDGEEWQLEVTDEKGLVLFTLDFIATLAPSAPS